MTDFEGVVIGLLLVIVGRVYANGHDVRGDWTTVEQVGVAAMIASGCVLIGVYATRWILP